MHCILCIDNSGSTRHSLAYWERVSDIYHTRKPSTLIFWNTIAEVMKTFQQVSVGRTEPQSFIKLLEKETTLYDLIITTDGDIKDMDIEECSRRVTSRFLSFVNSTVIYYIGSEESMNIGLNVIFGRTKQMSYHINDKFYKCLYDKFDTLSLEDLMSPNFAISLIVKIKHIEMSVSNQSIREAKIGELREDICKLYSKFEPGSLDVTLDEKLEIYFKNNEMENFVNLLSQDFLNRQKCEILNMFDRRIDFNISRISKATAIQEQVIEVTTQEESGWSQFEDVITLDKFNLPCLLVQNVDTPLITDKVTLKHPFKLLSQSSVIKKILQLIEANPIDYTTYQKLDYDHRNYVVSPYTRVSCKGVFVLDTTDTKCLKNNCRTISVLFGNDNKVPGSLVLWNLMILYLLYKYKFNNTEYEGVILEQIITYCKYFTATLSFSHQCQVLRPARIEICLWYCINVAPTLCPNTSKNVLRSPFGLELLHFYLNTFGHEQIGDIYLKRLVRRVKKWAVWNYLLTKKGNHDLGLEVRAQYQNYCIHKDDIILLPGKCEVPYKSKCNLVNPDIVNTLYLNITNYSSKLDNIDDFETTPAQVDYNDLKDVSKSLTHVKINIKTCWPYVICPITKLHWRECAGDYDVKNGSHVRIFNVYCSKNNVYPKNHMDLALLFSKWSNNCVVKSRAISNFEYVYCLFEEVMATYTCEEYLGVYMKHTNEKSRLSKE